MTAPFKIVEPLAVNDTIITATNVEEDFLYPEYVPATGYTKGMRVKYTPAHAVFESVFDGTNTGHTPGTAGSEAYWLRVSATNKYKMYDTSPSTSTVANGTSFFYSFKFYSFVTTMAID